MIVHFVEVTDLAAYGKFIVARMDAEELMTPSSMPMAAGALLLNFAGHRRFGRRTTLVLDLQRGTGAAWTLKPLDMDAYQREKLAGLLGGGRGATARTEDILQIPAYLELPGWPKNSA